MSHRIKRSGNWFLLAVVFLFTANAVAALCPKCANMAFTADIGKCVVCGGMTTSGSFKLCKTCSEKLGQCEACRAPLKATTQPATRPATQPATRPTKRPASFQ